MIVPYIRSSSYNTYDFCELKYFLEYCCGVRGFSTKKSSDMGNMLHKALELLARRKLAEQNGETTVTEPETSPTPYDISLLTPEFCIEVAYKHYAEKTKNIFDWDAADYDSVKKWLKISLEYNGGQMSPLNQTIVMPESYFDIEIKRPWAWYSWSFGNGNKLEGYLSIKGTIDLIVKHDDNCYELIDYKSGRCFDWIKSREKDYKSLLNDPQLNLYMLAASNLYPKPSNWICTIFYPNNSGAFSMNFDKEKLFQVEKMLERRFTQIRNNFRPRAINPHYRCSWCSFAKTDVQGNKVDNYEQSLCRQVRTELVQLGYDRTFEKHWKPSSLTQYTGGGAERA